MILVCVAVTVCAFNGDVGFKCDYFGAAVDRK